MNGQPRPDLISSITSRETFEPQQLFPEKICDELDIDILQVLGPLDQEKLIQTTSSGLMIEFPDAYRQSMLNELDRLLAAFPLPGETCGHFSRANHFYVLCLAV